MHVLLSIRTFSTGEIDLFKIAIPYMSTYLHKYFYLRDIILTPEIKSGAKKYQTQIKEIALPLIAETAHEKICWNM